MVFSKDKLHCHIFTLVLFIYHIFIGPCELANISQAYFFHPLLALFWDPLSLVS